jgi:hypothetical protein
MPARDTRPAAPNPATAPRELPGSAAYPATVRDPPRQSATRHQRWAEAKLLGIARDGGPRVTYPARPARLSETFCCSSRFDDPVRMNRPGARPSSTRRLTASNRSGACSQDLINDQPLALIQERFRVPHRQVPQQYVVMCEVGVALPQHAGDGAPPSGAHRSARRRGIPASLPQPLQQQPGAGACFAYHPRCGRFSPTSRANADGKSLAAGRCHLERHRSGPVGAHARR